MARAGVNYQDLSEDPGGNWNNVLAASVTSTGVLVANLNDLDTGSPTGWGLEHTNAFDVTREGDPGWTGGTFPQLAIDGSWSNNDGVSDTSTVRLTGLNNSLTYNIEPTGSRNLGGSNRMTRYSISGETDIIIDATNNQTVIALFSNVSPVSGNIDLTIAGETPGTDFSYLNAFVITENTPQSPPVQHTPIPDQTTGVGDFFRLRCMDFFDQYTDASSLRQQITFTATGLPDKWIITPEGFIEGVVTAETLAGSPYTVDTFASVPLGTSTTDDTFDITVQATPVNTRENKRKVVCFETSTIVPERPIQNHADVGLDGTITFTHASAPTRVLPLFYDGYNGTPSGDIILADSPFNFYEMDAIDAGPVATDLGSAGFDADTETVSLGGFSVIPNDLGDSYRFDTTANTEKLTISTAPSGAYNFMHDGSDFSIETWWKTEDHDPATNNTQAHAFFNTASALTETGVVFLYRTLTEPGSPGFDRQFQFRIFDSSGTALVVVTTPVGSITNNIGLHHLVVTGDGQFIRIYVDGVLLATSVDLGTLTLPVGNHTDVPFIGGTTLGRPDHRLSNFATYTTALSQADIDLRWEEANRSLFKSSFRARIGETGLWSYSVASADTDLNGQAGSFTVDTALGSDLEKELTPDGQYIVDQDGEVVQLTLASASFDIGRENEPDELVVIGADRGSPRETIDFIVANGFEGIFTTALVFQDLGPPNITQATYTTVGEVFDLTYWKRIDRIYEYAMEQGLAIRQWLYSDDENRPVTSTIGWDTNGTTNVLTAMDQRLIDYALARFGAFPSFWLDLGVDLNEFRNAAWSEDACTHISTSDYYDIGLWGGSRHGPVTNDVLQPADANYYSDELRTIPTDAHMVNMFENDVQVGEPIGSLRPAVNMDRNDEESVVPAWPLHSLRYTLWRYILNQFMGFAAGDEDAVSVGDFGGYLSVNVGDFTHAPHNLIATNFKASNIIGDKKLLLTDDSLLTATGNNALARNGSSQFIAWIEDGQNFDVDLTSFPGDFDSYFFNPRDGVQEATVQITGGVSVNFTSPTTVVGDDWVLVIQLSSALAGQGGLAFGGASALLGGSNIDGQSNLDFDGAATLLSEGVLLGVGNLTFGGDAGIGSSEQMDGQGALVFDGTAELLSVDLVGIGNMVFDGEATITQPPQEAPDRMSDPTSRLRYWYLRGLEEQRALREYLKENESEPPAQPKPEPTQEIQAPPVEIGGFRNYLADAAREQARAEQQASADQMEELRQRVGALSSSIEEQGPAPEAAQNDEPDDPFQSLEEQVAADMATRASDKSDIGAEIAESFYRTLKSWERDDIP